MQAKTIPRAVAAAAVIVAGGLVLLARAPSDVSPPAVQPADNSPTHNAPVVLAAAPMPSDDAVIAAKIRELEAMSETFRNTTFVIAIRDAGYTCNELLRVYGGFGESGKWTATCSEMLAYTLGVTGKGALHVDPMMQYWDGIAAPAIRQDFEPKQPLRNSIPVVPPPER
jgi:hypothetical protein